MFKCCAIKCWDAMASTTNNFEQVFAGFVELMWHLLASRLDRITNDKVAGLGDRHTKGKANRMLANVDIIKLNTAQCTTHIPLIYSVP